MSAEVWVVIGGAILAGIVGMIWSARQYDRQIAFANEVHGRSLAILDEQQELGKRSLALLDRHEQSHERSLALLDRQQELMKRAEALLERMEKQRDSG